MNWKPYWNRLALKIWRRNYLFFKRTLLVSFFWTVFEPLMYLGSIGFGLGAFVNSVQGKSYIEFFLPGLLATTAMLVPYFECTYGNYAKLTWQKIYHSMLMTPIQANDIVLGEALWGTSKGFFGVLGVTLVASFFGLIQSWYILPTLLILAMISWIFSCLGMIITSYAKNYDSFIYATSGVIVPMSLFSGTYFPLSSVPEGFRYLFYFLPLTHGVESARSIFWGQLNLNLFIHLFIMIMIAYFSYLFALHRMQKRLQA